MILGSSHSEDHIPPNAGMILGSSHSEDHIPTNAGMILAAAILKIIFQLTQE
jgi:hypothetical protein